ncbi:hypothetical protein JHK87_050119 [Glycine soja]|nr:hypothetical protein JHK87_050119 [Glycine soja]
MDKPIHLVASLCKDNILRVLIELQGNFAILFYVVQCLFRFGPEYCNRAQFVMSLLLHVLNFANDLVELKS